MSTNDLTVRVKLEKARFRRTSETTPEPDVFSLEDPVPETRATTPGVSETIPETKASAPETSATAPETSATIPETKASAPETAASKPFQIDVVYTWVDGKDEAHRKALGLYLPNESKRKSPSDVTKKRWTNHNELLYSVRSVLKFAPWIGDIYVVVSHDQCPSFFNRDKVIRIQADGTRTAGGENTAAHRLILVNDSVIFGAAGMGSHLPTFNSQAIEAHLHRIPGISEHFIYLCDDMMFGQPMHRTDFFDFNGNPVILHRGYILYKAKTKVTAEMPGYKAARINAHALLAKLFGRAKAEKSYDLCHQAKAITKSDFESAWANPDIARAFELTSKSRFRGHDNVEIFTVALWNRNWDPKKSSGLRQLEPREQFHEPKSRSTPNDISTLNKNKPKWLSMNEFTDGHLHWMSKLCPALSPWEKGIPATGGNPQGNGPLNQRKLALAKLAIIHKRFSR